MSDKTINELEEREQEAFNALADAVAERVLAKLAERMTFPTPQDVERIRDHVDPNGVAFANGYKAGQRSYLTAYADLRMAVYELVRWDWSHLLVDHRDSKMVTEDVDRLSNAFKGLPE